MYPKKLPASILGVVAKNPNLSKYQNMLYAKKSLGQNFLRSKAAIFSIIEAGEIDGHDIVLEVGPGKGILTEELLKVAREVIAVEKDDRLVLFLTLKFKREIEEKKLILIHKDILEFDPEEEGLQAGGYKIIANIPYYITGTFLRRFLSVVSAPSRMVLMLQKEVARRIVARDEKESILSLSIKAYGEPVYIETVKAESFSPQPKVDSAILLVKNISKKFFTENCIVENVFFTLIKTGFGQKRKKLSSNIKEILGGAEKAAAAFSACNIPENARAADAPLSKWKCLARFQGSTLEK